MTDPEVISDRERYAAAGRAYRQLQARRRARLAVAWRARDDAAGAEELICGGRQRFPEPRELLEHRARGGSSRLEEEIRVAMVEGDPTTRRT